MRKLILAVAVTVSTITTAIASADTRTSSVYESRDSYDVDAMYGASRSDAIEAAQRVAIVASAGRMILPSHERDDVFASRYSYDVAAMYGASRPAAASKTDGTFVKFLAE